VERGLRRVVLIAAVAAAVAVLLAPSAPAAPALPLAHKGRFFTDALGRVVVMHGLNMVDKIPPYHPAAIGFGEDDAALLEREGFDSVRLGIIWKGLEPRPGVYDDAYLDRIVATAQLLWRHHVIPLVDFHQDQYNERFNGEGAPDWAVRDDGLPAQPNIDFPTNYFVMPALQRAYDHFWANDPGAGDGVGMQDRYAAAWAHVAQRFAADSALVGFDVYNEPWPGTPWPTCATPSGCQQYDQQVLTPFYRRVFAAIRRVDPGRLLFYEPWPTFGAGADTGIGKPGDAASGFSFHDYCLGETGGTMEDQTAENPGQAMGCPVGEQRVFDNALAQSARTGDVPFLTEFGAADKLDELGRLADEADGSMMSWEEWAYFNRDTCCARPAEGVVYDPAKPLSGANVKQAKLGVLVRPYPEAIAGTPRKWSYDRAGGTFKLAYATARAGGGVFAATTQTEIRTPARSYPGGYRTQVTGAAVSSAPGAAVLTLRNLPGAAAVSVTVTRGAPAAAIHGVHRRLRLSLRTRCSRRRLVATVSGADRGRIRRVDFLLGSRVVARDRRAPFRTSLRLRRSHRYSLRARVHLRAGGSATLRRRVRGCR
jgi:endoglycosylceramidase